MNELQLARLDGKTWDEVQTDVVKLVYYYVGLWYNNYPVLKQFGYDSERIITDVFHGLCLKTREDGLSNIERAFLKASSSKGFTMSYISNVIKRSVLNMLMCRSRDESKKLRTVSLEQPIELNNGSVSLEDIIADPKEPFENTIDLKIDLSSVPNKKYTDYYYINSFSEQKTLTTKTILNWMVAGYTLKEIRLKIINKKTKANINMNILRSLKKETILILKEYLQETKYFI